MEYIKEHKKNILTVVLMLLVLTLGLGLATFLPGTTEASDDPYWTANDWYNIKSSGSLVLLERYEPVTQETAGSGNMEAALSVLNWYGLKGDLTPETLGYLRDNPKTDYNESVSVEDLTQIFNKLTDMNLTGQWEITSSAEIKKEANGGEATGAGDRLISSSCDPTWIEKQLKKGIPIIVIWNSFGPHAQVIIGYDSLGTPETGDDQLIVMEPYDVADHNKDGYHVVPFERLVCGYLYKDGKSGKDGVNTEIEYFAAVPKDWTQDKSQVGTKKLKRVTTNKIKSSSENTLYEKWKSPLYNKTVSDLEANKEYSAAGTTGAACYGDANQPGYNDSNIPLSGAAGWERAFDVDESPYYVFNDYYTGNVNSSSLILLRKFKTAQQATDWTCGCTSALMVIEHFGKNGSSTKLESEITLSENRQEGEMGATCVGGMKEMFDYMNETHNQDWVYFTNEELTGKSKNTMGAKEHPLEGGEFQNGLIPYLLKNDIPMMIGWDDWGGHWQTIVGYDSMGTETTKDDVLILADPYDTTDHDSDGYYVESFQRLVDGWYAAFEEAESGKALNKDCFVVAFPRSKAVGIADEFGL
ncbi:MAG: hypothetical protein HUJ79_04125 [Firmicutes bacterium]|nr:hypothetical protein [Bacillota bacterium]